MRRVSAILISALIAGVSACEAVDEQSLLTADETDQAARAAASLVLDVYDRESILIFGELHGTVETPALVGTIVDRLAESQPVTLALEISRQEQARIDTFIQSNGSPGAVSDLLAGEFWKPSPSGSDGRRSEAVVAMIDTIRRSHADGKRVRIVTLDDNEFFRADVDRRDGMARSIEALATDLEDGPVVALMGNFHARVTVFSERLILDGVPIEPFVPTAARVSGVPLTSVNATACSGGFWGCMNGACGLQELMATCPVPDRATLSATDPDLSGYHFSLVLETLTPSPPAR